jgi:hypothetical protein
VKRRAFVTLLGGAAWQMAVRAQHQQQQPVPMIGFLIA